MPQIFNAKNAPAAVGPYSQAVIHQGTIHLSGQLGLNPATGKLEEGVEAQARQALANIKAVLEEAGTNMNNIIRCRVFLTDLNNFQIMNQMYIQAMGDHKPARTTIQVAGLPMGGLVEIEATAAI